MTQFRLLRPIAARAISGAVAAAGNVSAATAGDVPTYVDSGQDPSPADPGFVAGSNLAEQLVIDFGLASNSPTGYDVVLTSNGDTIPGSSATNVTAYAYGWSSTYAFTMIAAEVTPRNSAGPGPTAYIPAVEVTDAAASPTGLVTTP